MYNCLVYLVYLFSVISQNLGWLLLQNHDSVVKIAPAPAYVQLWLIYVNLIIQMNQPFNSHNIAEFDVSPYVGTK